MDAVVVEDLTSVVDEEDHSSLVTVVEDVHLCSNNDGEDLQERLAVNLMMDQ